MSFDTYISLMVSVVVVAIISILVDLRLAHIEFKQNMQDITGRRKIKSLLLKYNEKEIMVL